MREGLSGSYSEIVPYFDFLHTKKKVLLTAYVFVGTLFLNCGLYYFCRHYFEILPLKPAFFIFKVTQDGLFPSYGYVICLLPAIASSFFTHLSFRVKNPVIKATTVLVGQVTALILSMTILPGTVVLVFLHLAFGVLAAFVACSEILVWGSQTEWVGDPRFQRDALRLRHQRLTTVLTQFIWGAVTVLVGGFTFLIAALALFLTNPGVRWEPGVTEHFLFMIHDFGSILLGLAMYYLAGIVVWIAVPSYLELIRIENLAGSDSEDRNL